MLVLSRKKNETIEIGIGEHKITLVVVEQQHGKVRIGIEAPSDVPILRGELVGRERPAA